MAFNLEVFKTRALTALVFVAIMLTGLLWNEWSFFLLFTVIHVGCWVEYQKIMTLIYLPYAKRSPFHRYGMPLIGWLMMLSAAGSMLGVSATNDRLLSLSIAILLVLVAGSQLLSRNKDLRSLALSAFGLLYISVSWSLLLHLRSGALWLEGEGGTGMFAGLLQALGKYVGYMLPLVIIATIWINDTMAYLVGSFIGRTPLSALSPKKTWEGTIGGIVLSVLVVTLVGVFALQGDALHFIAVSLIAAVAGTFGDLFESKLKRLAGIKDSGQLLPGHGGFLDRFDSLLFAVPFVWLLCALFLS